MISESFITQSMYFGMNTWVSVPLNAQQMELTTLTLSLTTLLMSFSGNNYGLLIPTITADSPPQISEETSFTLNTTRMTLTVALKKPLIKSTGFLITFPFHLTASVILRTDLFTTMRLTMEGASTAPAFMKNAPPAPMTLLLMTDGAVTAVDLRT